MDKATSIVLNYIDKPKTDYALLINGKWGSGKTFFWREVISKEIKNKNLTPIYISLNGLKNLNSIWDSIFWQKNTNLNKIFKSKTGKIVTGTLNMAFNAFAKNQKIGADTNNIVENYKIEDFLDFKKNILCFDDLERISEKVSMKEILGFINTNFLEHNKVKVIFLCDESQIENEKKYYKVKEKLIRTSIDYTPDLAQVFKEIIQKYNFSKPFKNQLDNSIVSISNNFQNAEHINLRTFQFILDYLSDIDKLRAVEDEEIIHQIISFVTILSIEFKKANIKSLADLPIYFTCSSGLAFYFNEKNKTQGKSKLELYNTKLRKTYKKKLFRYFFEEIAKSILNGIVDKESVKREITYFTELSFSTRSKPHAKKITELWNFKKLDNVEFNLLIKELKGYIRTEVYSIYELIPIASYFKHFMDKGLSLGFENHKDMFEWISRYFNEDNISGDSSILSREYRDKEKDWNAFLDKASMFHNRISQELKRNSITDIIRQFKKEPNEIPYSDFHKLVEYWETDFFVDFLKNTSFINLMNFNQTLEDVYHARNLQKDYYNEKPKLDALLNKLHEFINQLNKEKKAMTFYHFTNTVDILSEILTRFEEEVK